MAILKVTVVYPKCLFPDSIDERQFASAVGEMHQIVLSGQKLEISKSVIMGGMSIIHQVWVNEHVDKRGMLMLVGLVEKADAFLVGRVGIAPNSNLRRFSPTIYLENEGAAEIELPTRLFH